MLLKGRLAIIDPSLKDERGHHYALTKAISDGALKNGLDVLIFANRNVSSLPELNKAEIFPVFSSTTYDIFIKQNVKQPSPHYIKILGLLTPSLLFRLKSFKKKFMSLLRSGIFSAIDRSRTGLPLNEELLLAIKQHKLNKSDHILIHTADGEIYRELLQLSLKSNFNDLPYFHVNTPYDDKVMPHYNKSLPPKRVINYLKLLGKIESRVFLYAENKLLAHYLESIWSTKVCPLEIPPAVVRHKHKKKSCKDPLNVVYIGSAREEKGFLLIPDIVKNILDSEERKNIKFTIQCSPQIIGYLPVISKAIDKLKEFPSEIVSLKERPQSMNEYFATIEKADVVLLCYDKTRYGVRGSGIAVEAVTFGKIIIASPETFPAYVAGDAAVIASNAKEVAKAIISISQDKGFYLKRASDRQKKYLKGNTSEGYFKSMAKRIKESAPVLDKELGFYQKSNEYASEKTIAPTRDVKSILTSLLQGNDNEASLIKLVKFKNKQ